MMRAALLLAIALSGCTTQRGALVDVWPQPLTDAVVTVAQGREVFVARELGHCVLCHRVDDLDVAFQGDLGPALDDVGARLSPAQIRLRIIDASRLNPATIMPPYYRTEALHRVSPEHAGRPVLTALQIEQLVRYLSSLESST